MFFLKNDFLCCVKSGYILRKEIENTYV